MLELIDLTRRFGDVVALDAVSFVVPPGQIVGFLGPNGAGKTTAMRIVLGVLEPDRGEVRWRGRPADLSTRRRFGYMPEERGLYPKMRVLDQLVYLARLHGLSDADADASSRRSLATLGVEDRAGDRVEQLSLGNQQRVQLGVALVHDPEVLVLDEPFSGLDPTGVDVMSGVLAERAEQGVPVVFSSHQLELVEHEHLGVVDERDAELDALLVAERERLDLVAGALGQPEPLDPGVGGGERLSGAEPVQPREVHELVADAHLRVQAALLGHVAEPAARGRVDLPALPADLARVGLEDAQDDPHRGRLARPVRADEAEQAAGRGAEREVVERKRAAEAAPESDQLEHRSFVYPPQSS